MTGATDGAFAALANAIIDGLLERQPEWATVMGDHRYDGRLTIGTPGYYAELSRWAGQQLAELAAIDSSQLSIQNRVDSHILADHLTGLRFGIDDLREHTWNPRLANPGPEALYPLLARNFAPLPERLQSAAQRLSSVPEALAAARAVLTAMPEEHINQALWQFEGSENFISKEFGQLAQENNGAAPDLGKGVEAAVAAIGEHRRWLEQRLEDGGFRDPRLGAELYGTKLRLMLETDLPAEVILARAEADLARVGEAIKAAAGGESQVWHALDMLKRDATDPATILSFGRAVISQLREFVTQHDLVTVYDDPLNLIDMPEMDWGTTIGYCNPPGPLETAQLPTFIALSPPPPGWSADEIQSYYGEHNRHMIHNFLTHEGMPGHWLQDQHFRRYSGSSTPVRAVLWSVPFAEGWATYGEELIAGLGYPGEANPDAYLLLHLKLQLRTIINAILDIRVHCDGMTQEQGMSLMTGPGYQVEAEARNKFRRATLAEVKLPTYYVGAAEVEDVAADLRREHPGWPDRQVHDELLAHGMPPVRHLRTLLGIRRG
jgi:hypothetical protein